MKNKKDYKSVISNPSAAYAKPRDVILDTDFDKEQKIKILKQWEIDARELQVATEEGMGGGEDNMLKQVRDVLRNLTTENEDQSAPTKQGG